MKIFAKFDTVDDAEYAARGVRERFIGIKAVKIRYREIGVIAPDLPTKSFALFDSGDTYMVGNAGHGVLSGFSPVLYFDSDFMDIPDKRDLDGPVGRTECLLEISAESYSAQNVAKFLRSAHGRKINIIE